MHHTMPRSTFFTNMLLLTKIKVFKLIKDKKIGVNLLAAISLSDMLMDPSKQNPVPKIDSK